jgi:polyhydroxyalkanoate synthesis regulator phasin
MELSGEIEDEYPKGIRVSEDAAMNSDTAMDLLKKGFRITLGASTSLVESIQDPLKREENLALMQSNPNAFAELLAEKGAVAEVEARRVVDSVVTQYSSSSSASNPVSSSATTSSIDPSLERELRDLTAELAQIRSELINGSQSKSL